MVDQAERIGAKIPLRRVDSGSCAVMVGRVVRDGEIVKPGTPHYVHKGEWVDFIPVTSVGEFLSLIGMRNGDGDTAASQLTALSERLAKRIVGWSWTNMIGAPLEQPYGRPDVLLGLTEDELYWLMARSFEEESEEERKNA